VEISRDYPRKTQTSKQPIGKILGYEIIPSHPLKYPRSKQGLDDPRSLSMVSEQLGCRFFLGRQKERQYKP
jgi:hypothetical protein